MLITNLTTSKGLLHLDPVQAAGRGVDSAVNARPALGRSRAGPKAELREMLAEAVRNTQRQDEPEPQPKTEKDR